MRITHTKLHDVLLEPPTMTGNVVLVGTHLVRRHRFGLLMLLVDDDPEGRSIGQLQSLVRRCQMARVRRHQRDGMLGVDRRPGTKNVGAACCRTCLEVSGECVGGVRLALHVNGVARDVADNYLYIYIYIYIHIYIFVYVYVYTPLDPSRKTPTELQATVSSR